MRRQAVPISAWERRLVLRRRLRLIRDYVLGSLALVGFAAFWIYLLTTGPR